jgi:uncharacterized protein
MRTLLSGGLRDLATELLPPEERYTYQYRGSSEDLDHILVSPSLLAGGRSRVWIVHRFAEYLYGERATDHDPVLAALDMTPRRPADRGDP